MNKYFLMQARQTGKTSKAVYEYLKDPLDTVFVVTNDKNKERIIDKIGDKNANVLTEEEFLTEHYCASRNYILDEYMFFKHKKDVYEKVNSLDPENLFIFSTSDKVYKKDIFDFVFELGQIYSHLRECFKSMMILEDEIKQQEVLPKTYGGFECENQ